MIEEPSSPQNHPNSDNQGVLGESPSGWYKARHDAGRGTGGNNCRVADEVALDRAIKVQVPVKVESGDKEVAQLRDKKMK